MPVVRLYMENTYLFASDATVTAIGNDEHGDFVTLDKTIFHPNGGGQPDDVGTINGMPVVKLVLVGDKKSGEIQHYVKSDKLFAVGDTVDLKIEPAVRTQNAALHSMGHILHALLLAKPHSLGKQTACNHRPKESSVTYESKGRPMPKAEELAAAVQKIIDNKTPLSIRLIDGVRHLEVDGYPPVPCGGTHIRNASELQGFDWRSPIKYDKKCDTYKFSYAVGYNMGLIPTSVTASGDSLSLISVRFFNEVGGKVPAAAAFGPSQATEAVQGTVVPEPNAAPPADDAGTMSVIYS